ncbi:MAG: hypothetical protein EBR82_25670 [Caulobacteraceae bacterium]|nr:hypothetical protein [Caulobacteraceae bacterium]
MTFLIAWVRGYWDIYRTAVIGLLIAALIGLAVPWAAGLFSPVEAATGRITGFGISVGRSPHPIARVRVDGRPAEVRGPGDSRCRIGSEITLERRRSLIGPRYAVASIPEPCRA